MPPKKGTKQRNFPTLTLEQALLVPRAIQDQAAGQNTSRITLADLLDRSPGSSEFERMVRASLMFGLTTGHSRSSEFALTALGHQATSGDEVAQAKANRSAILLVNPFRIFLESHNGKRLPAAVAMKEFLTRNAEVPEQLAQECMDQLLENARFVGFLAKVKGGAEWVALEGAAPPAEEIENQDGDDEYEEYANGSDRRSQESREQNGSVSNENHSSQKSDSSPLQALSQATKVFIAHGKNRAPLEELKKMLDQFKVDYAVAVDTPHGGRPISAKVANLMRDECSSGIFIFTADEKFLKEIDDNQTQEIWRPSENVVYELGAASILYENRIVIFKEDKVTFPSDFSDLGYITFKPDQLVQQMGNLFQELVKLDILEVRAKR